MVLGPGHADQQRESTGGSFVSHRADFTSSIGQGANMNLKGTGCIIRAIRLSLCVNVVLVRKVGAVKTDPRNQLALLGFHCW